MPAESERSIVLIGPRAAGKTTLAQALARRLAWPWRDGDAALAASVGEAAGSWLARVGETAFRAAEERATSALLDEAERAGPAVISLGGGAVLSRAVHDRLASGRFAVVLVVAEPETLARRIAASSVARPRLTELPLLEEVEAISRARMPVYEKLARLVVDTTRAEVETSCEQVLAHLGHTGR